MHKNSIAINFHQLTLVFTFIFIQASQAQIKQEDCAEDTFAVDISGDSINWNQFPYFSLPFPVIYHGDKPSDMKPHPLNKGFSHIEGHVRTYAESIPYKKRVYLWTGIAGADGWAKENNQPWEAIKSPWGNDI